MRNYVKFTVYNADHSAVTERYVFFDDHNPPKIAGRRRAGEVASIHHRSGCFNFAGIPVIGEFEYQHRAPTEFK